jgi:hypothetical protein
VMLRKVKVCALDRLLLERFGGKVGRGLAAGMCGPGVSSNRADSLFAAVLTVYSQGSENTLETEDNAGTNKRLWCDGGSAGRGLHRRQA